MSRTIFDRLKSGPLVPLIAASIVFIGNIACESVQPKTAADRTTHSPQRMEHFAVIADSAKVDGNVHDGNELQVDLPAAQHVKNFGAPADGKGLCVFASMTMAARWHHIQELSDIIHQINDGGGWPEKVDKVFAKHAPNLKYVQYEGKDPAVLDKALAENEAACVTYGYGERYNMSTIYHMVMLVYLDSHSAAILDNNFPGTYEWMSRDEFLKRWVHPSGKGWAYVMLAPPPPPPPHN